MGCQQSHLHKLSTQSEHDPVPSTKIIHSYSNVNVDNDDIEHNSSSAIMIPVTRTKTMKLEPMMEQIQQVEQQKTQPSEPPFQFSSSSCSQQNNQNKQNIESWTFTQNKLFRKEQFKRKSKTNRESGIIDSEPQATSITERRETKNINEDQSIETEYRIENKNVEKQFLIQAEQENKLENSLEIKPLNC